MSIGYLEVQMHLRDVETADVDRLLRVLHEMGGTYTVIEHAVARAVGMPPDVEAPPAQWWESLEEPPRGGPRANIYTAHANVQMYAEPFFDVKDGMLAEARGRQRLDLHFRRAAASVSLERNTEVFRHPLL